MALPIAPTPILEGKEASDFLKKLEEGRKNKKPLVSTPKLNQVREMILANAEREKE